MKNLAYIVLTALFINAPVWWTLPAAVGVSVPRGITVAVFIILLIFWLKLNTLTVLDRFKTGIRLKAAVGGGIMLNCLVAALIYEPIFFTVFYGKLIAAGLSHPQLFWAIFFAMLNIGLLYIGGLIRICSCAKSVSILRKIAIAMTLYIPVINIAFWIGASHMIKKEYQSGIERASWEKTLPEEDICRTKYPILMLHGVGFRDMKLANYWGRIPRYLKRLGADIYYGKQSGLGTIETSGGEVAERIREICGKTGAEKVNIIAHSKGGLDARYAISSCGMDSSVASLTTMNTPHHGVRFADTATKLRLPIYLRIASVFNSVFRGLGDNAPDFYAATMQFRTEDARVFNEQNPDSPKVYYQSYTSVMSRPSSDMLLAATYYAIKRGGEESDGLVSIDSAKWGNFRGVLRNNKGRRGISHADIVDMHREDYRGFNVLDTYIKIVSELKEAGY